MLDTSRSAPIEKANVPHDTMTDDNKQKKLFGKKQALMTISAMLCGMGLFAFRNYSRKGHLDGADLFATVLTGVLGAIMITSMAWYANKPEDKEK